MGKTLQSHWLQRAWPPGEKAWERTSKSPLLFWPSDFLPLLRESWGSGLRTRFDAFSFLPPDIKWVISGVLLASKRTSLPRCRSVLFWVRRFFCICEWHLVCVIKNLWRRRSAMLHIIRVSRLVSYTTDTRFQSIYLSIPQYLLSMYARLCSRHCEYSSEQRHLASANNLTGRQTTNQSTNRCTILYQVYKQ